MRKQRSIRNRGRRKKIAPIDLDITSLLDIIVILLVFLLNSYNASGITLNVPKSVQLPTSESTTLNNAGVIIQVAPGMIWVDDKEIMKVGTGSASRHYDHGGRRIIPLYNELVAKKQVIQRVEKTAQNAKPFSGIVNLIVDKSIRYSEVKKILYTAAEAGFRQYKFVVLSQER
jgi:biopolymer transport protein ExbD